MDWEKRETQKIWNTYMAKTLNECRMHRWNNGLREKGNPEDMEYLHDEDIKRIQSTIVNINILCFMYMLFQVEFLAVAIHHVNSVSAIFMTKSSLVQIRSSYPIFKRIWVIPLVTLICFCIKNIPLWLKWKTIEWFNMASWVIKYHNYGISINLVKRISFRLL
jgi:hypothetical protein